MCEENWTGSWCAQCGPNVKVDEDGCCISCGLQAIGDGAEEALTAARERDALRERVEALRLGILHAIHCHGSCVKPQYLRGLLEADNRAAIAPDDSTNRETA